MSAETKLTDDEQLLCAALEQQARRKIRSSFDCFCLACGYWPGLHHRFINAKLEQVARGEAKRLMILVGPGTAKSTYVSQLFAAWLMIQKTPHGMPWDILMTTCTENLSEDFSRETKRIIRDNPLCTGYGINKDFDTASSWQTDKGDKYRCYGANSRIAGIRADVGIGDDWVGDEKSAASPADRKAIWRWYLSDFRPRIKPSGAMVIINTRRHQDDHCGMILPDSWQGETGMIEARDGEMWDVVCLPTQAMEDDPLGREEGEYIWPEWFPKAHWEQEKKTAGPDAWWKIYQQVPKPATGGSMELDWFGTYKELPKGCRFVLTSDFAVTQKKTRDPTAHMVWAVDSDSRLYLVDTWHKHSRTGEGIEAALDLIAEYDCYMWLNEKGVIWASIGAAVEKRAEERGIIVRHKQYARKADKLSVCGSFIARAEQGKVFIPSASRWLPDVMDEWCNFGATRHDEYFDCAALMGLFVSEVIAPVRGKMHGTAQGMTVRL